LQLFIEGPKNKAFIFLSGEHFPVNPELQVDKASHFANYAYLRGKKLGDILHIEERATALSLAETQQPYGTLYLPSLTPQSLGQIILYFQILSAFSGLLAGVNPFDQPAVEMGKEIQNHLLGKKGYEQPPRSLSKARETKKKWVF